MIVARLEHHSPGLDKLIAATRIERLSLSWLATGEGSPYLVHVTDSDEDAMGHVTLLREDQPDLATLIVYSGARFVVVLHGPAETESDSESYAWRQVEVVTGALGPRTAAAATPGAQYLPLDPERLRRLATGWMGNAELFGWEASEGLIAQHQLRHHPAVSIVREDTAEWPTATPDIAQHARDREALDLLHAMDDADQQTALRLLRGLARSSNP